jgi:hypothetical protein
MLVINFGRREDMPPGVTVGRGSFTMQTPDVVAFGRPHKFTAIGATADLQVGKRGSASASTGDDFGPEAGRLLTYDSQLCFDQ